MVEQTSDGRGEAEHSSLDLVFDCLANSDRRRIVELVYDRSPEPVPCDELATAVAGQAAGKPQSDVTAAERQQAAVTHHHIHLPKLTAAGLVEYDPEDGTVAYRGHPQLRAPWMHSVLQTDFGQSLTGESNPAGIGEIQGREDVISYD